MTNEEKTFEEEWKKHIEEYGGGFGRFWNGLKRRKMIAKKFYYTGCKVALKEAIKIRLRPRK